MKRHYSLFLLFLSIMLSCTEKPKKEQEISNAISVKGTWKMKMGFSIFGHFVTLLTQSGTWNMHLEE